MRAFLSFLSLSRCLYPSPSNYGPRYTDRLRGQLSPVSGGTRGEAAGAWSWFLPLKFTVWGSIPPFSPVPSLYVALLSTGTALPLPFNISIIHGFPFVFILPNVLLYEHAGKKFMSSCYAELYMQANLVVYLPDRHCEGLFWSSYYLYVFVSNVLLTFLCFYWRCDYLWFRWMLAAAAFSLTPGVL